MTRGSWGTTGGTSALAECIRMSRYGLTTMVLVQRRAHGDRIAELLAKVNMRGEFINGTDDSDGRKRALARLWHR